jgi:hypothetical protein
LTDFETIAREVSGYRTPFEAIERRLGDVETVNGWKRRHGQRREISGHWDAVYEAMRRKDETPRGPLNGDDPLAAGQAERRRVVRSSMPRTRAWVKAHAFALA